MSARTALISHAPRQEQPSAGVAASPGRPAPRAPRGQLWHSKGATVPSILLRHCPRRDRSWLSARAPRRGDRSRRPTLREVQLWAAACEPSDLTRLSSTDVARQFASVPGRHGTICTAEAAFVPAFESCPYLDDVDLGSSMAASLCISTTLMLARLAPYVRVGDAVIRAYRPSNVLRDLVRRPPSQVR